MSKSSPFDVLSGLAERSRQVAVELPPKENAQTHWNGLGFSLLGQRFVAPMRDVSELLRVPVTTKLPGVKNFVVGVANVRGRLLVVLDLAMFFGEGSAFARAQRRVLAIERGEQYFGFMIDESLGMQHFPSEAFSESAEEVSEKFKPFLDGCYGVGTNLWPIFSLHRLAGHPALQKLAASAA